MISNKQCFLVSAKVIEYIVNFVLYMEFFERYDIHINMSNNEISYLMIEITACVFKVFRFIDNRNVR